LPNPVFALLADVGSGKTKMGIDTAFMRHKTGHIDGVIIIASKGVHTQWIEEAIPEHAPEGMPWVGYCHDQKKFPELSFEELKFLALNFDAAKSPKTMAILRDFISKCRNLFLIIDESQNIKNKKSARWEAIFEIRKKCKYVTIMSGTPIAKDLLDYWAQYFMLDERIIGERYISSFKNKYCILGGFGQKEIIGYQNEVHLFKLTEPYTFRVKLTDLPPRRYKKIVFKMEAEQQRVYDSFKDTFVEDLNDPNSQAVQNPGVGLTRLQQITCGYLPVEDGTIRRFQNTRLECLKETLSGLDRKVIVWCRFHYDVEEIAKALGSKALIYYGKTESQEREHNKQKFINDSSVQYMVATAASAGAGIDGWQKVCNTNIYYSNSHKAIDRWQSEGRTNRKGMTEDHSLYIDLICKGGVDRGILRNLQKKKDLSDLMLDDIREMLND
jgi:SNF2 family DNA or RNA helicase